MQLWHRMHFHQQKNVYSQLYHPIQDEKTFLPEKPRTHQVSSDSKGHQLRAQRFKERSCWGRMGFGSWAQRRRREGRSSKGAALCSTSTTRNHQMVWNSFQVEMTSSSSSKNKKEKSLWNPWRPLQPFAACHRFSRQKTWGVCHTPSETEHWEKQHMLSKYTSK